MIRYNKIEFYKKIYSDTPYKEIKYVFLCKGFGRVKGLQGREFWASAQVNLQNVLKIQDLRYDKRILEAEVIKFDGKFYDIIQFDSPNYNKSQIELKVKEVVDIGEI